MTNHDHNSPQRSPFHISATDSSIEITDRSEISARLRPEKIDHPTERPANDDTERVFSQIGASIYSRRIRVMVQNKFKDFDLGAGLYGLF